MILVFALPADLCKNLESTTTGLEYQLQLGFFTTKTQLKLVLYTPLL
jgi:hypothetical protein